MEENNKREDSNISEDALLNLQEFLRVFPAIYAPEMCSAEDNEAAGNYKSVIDERLYKILMNYELHFEERY